MADHPAQRLQALIDRFGEDFERQQQLACSYVLALQESNAVWARVTNALLTQMQLRLDGYLEEIRILVDDLG